MKIEKLTITNLNSIEGTWEIDFSDPSFERSGLFAITGPTGAGKSTILDAISLALYSATPRLGIISENHNELMTKGTAVCSAEIVFKSQGERYRSSWTQKRSRQNASGNLQIPITKLEKYNYETKEWEGVSTGKKQFLNEIVKATGLTFQQFCRSVLIAQGQFAAFLSADKSEKAQSLEQITGTAIYGNISKQVYIKNAEVQRNFLRLKEQFNQTLPLPLEVREEKEKIKSSLQKEKDKLDAQLAEVRKALGWLPRYQELLEKRNLLQKERLALEEEDTDIEAKKAKLLKSQMAKEINYFHASLTDLRKEISETTKKITVLEKELSKELRQKEELENTQKRLKEQKLKYESEETALMALVEKVKPLDARIKSLAVEKNNFLEIQSRESAQLEVLLKNLQAKQLSLHSIEQELNKQKDWISNHKNMSLLKANAEDIARRKTNWEENIHLLMGLQRKTADASQCLMEEEKLYKACEHKTQVAETTLANARAQLLTLSGSLNQSLKGSNREELSKEKLELNQLHHDLRDAITVVENLKVYVDEFDSANKQIGNLEIGFKQQAVLIEKSQKIIEGFQQQIKDADLALQIASLDERRNELQPGSPCPLCGSLDHPFCIHLPESKDSVLKRKTHLEEEIQVEEKELIEARSKSTVIQTQLAIQKEKLAALKAKIEEEKSDCQKISQYLKVEWAGNPSSFKEKLLNKQKEVASKERDLNLSIEKALYLESEINKIKSSCEIEEKAYQELQEERRALKEKVQALAKALQETHSEKQAKAVEMQAELVEISERWKDFQQKPLSFEDVPNFLQQLLEMRKAYAIHESACQKLEEQSLNEKKVVQVQLDIAKDQEVQLQKLSVQLEEVNAQLQEATEQRKNLFQDKNTLVEEKEIAVKGRALETTFNALNRQLFEAENKITALTSTKDSLEPINKNLREKEVTEKAVWLKMLEERGFLTEEQWKESLLSIEEFQNLQKQVQEHDKKKSENDAQIKITDELINSKIQKREKDKMLKELASHSKNDLQNLQKKVHTALKKKEKEYLQISLELEKDDQAREANANIVKVMDEQSRICRYWSQLQELIGSAVGNKYREFAQRLTFSVLVKKANKALSQLSPRYLLCVRENTNFELDIIDHDLLDQVRPTENLSGGETFLVSLALALGLSEMAGQKVRIDSLFLDEGFGTLDDENLQRVLRMLEKLRYQGKLIGIISHVDKIKESIFPQISVIKETGGVSSLKGCGVTRIEEDKTRKSRTKTESSESRIRRPALETA